MIIGLLPENQSSNFSKNRLKVLNPNRLTLTSKFDFNIVQSIVVGYRTVVLSKMSVLTVIDHQDRSHAEWKTALQN